jgi:hypothetical protein
LVERKMGNKRSGQRQRFNPHTNEGKDLRDRRRVREALARGLDLKKALLAATDKGKEVVRADAALRRVERGLRGGNLGVRWQNHLDQAVLKHLVVEGLLRPEQGEAPKHMQSSWKRKDKRFAPWVFYRLTKKGRKLIEEEVASREKVELLKFS